jgi:hypothetical protein
VEGKMKKILFCFLTATILLWFACSKKSENGATVEVIDGIEYVHNTETPLFPEKAVAFEEELSIRSEDEKGNLLLFRPGWHLVDGKGFIYICDLQDLKIKVFDPDGDLVRTIGQKGGGPGEFQNIGEIALLPDDRLLMLDWEGNRISLFDKEGEFINSHKFRNWSYDFYVTTNAFYVRDENIFGPETQLSVKAYDLSGKELFSYGKFVHHHSLQIDEGGRRFSISPKPFDVYSIFAGDQKNARLYHCLNDKYLIEVYDQSGKLFRRIDRPYKLIPVRGKDREDYLDGIRGISESDRALVDKSLEMPSVKNITDSMIVDDLGNLWVETNEEKEEEGKIYTAFDIFNENGIYEARVWLDVSQVSLGLFKNGKMYTRETDEETGYRVYKRYRVIWSK